MERIEGIQHPARRRPRRRRRRRQRRQRQRQRRPRRQRGQLGAALPRPGAAGRPAAARDRRAAAATSAMRRATLRSLRTAAKKAAMIKVYTSSVIEAPADAVWAQVRDFNGLPKWTPFVAESRIEEGMPADRIGCVRNFRLQGRRRDPRAAADALGLRLPVQLLDPGEPDGRGELRRHPQAHAGHRRQQDLRRMVGRVRLRAGEGAASSRRASARACSRPPSIR